jgi:hypothetical protein
VGARRGAGLARAHWIGALGHAPDGAPGSARGAVGIARDLSQGAPGRGWIGALGERRGRAHRPRLEGGAPFLGARFGEARRGARARLEVM